jgi:hypothetical protein
MVHRISTMFFLPLSLCAAAFLHPPALYSEEFEDHTQKVFHVHPGGALILSVDGPVTVIPSDGQTVIIELDRTVGASDAAEAKQVLDDLEIESSQEADTIHYWVRSRCALLAARHQLSSWCRTHHYVDYPPNLHHAHFIITVPWQFNLDLTTGGGDMRIGDILGWLRAQDVGGSVSIGYVSGNVYAATGGGSIHLLGADGNADLETGGGNIHCDYVAGDAKLYTRAGAITLARAGGNVEAQTTGASVAVEAGGSIHAKIAGQPKSDSYFKTAAGEIILELPAEIKATIDAYGSRYSGRIDSDFVLTMEASAREELKGEINGGGPVIVIPDGAGDIHIRRRSM